MKKSKFDKKVCLSLTNNNRCKSCIFYQNLTHLSIKFGSSFGIKGKLSNKLIAVKFKGCAVLKEICPDCIVDTENLIQKDMIPRMQGYDDNIILSPAFVYPMLTEKLKLKNKKLYCPICKKSFSHKNIKHLIDVIKISKTIHPDIWTTTFTQRLKSWLRSFK